MERERKRERETDGQTGRQTDRPTDRQTDRHGEYTKQKLNIWKPFGIKSFLTA